MSMAMRIGRTLPPAAALLRFKDIASGIFGLFGGRKTVKRFEDELKDMYCTRHCFAVSSGKAALVLILQALRELSPERDEVLIPAYTCYSVPSAIVRAGLKVRLCDLAPERLDFDFDQLGEHLKNPRLLCVIPTHLFGMPADVERVKEMAGACGIKIIEDAAQAMGGEWNGKKLGTLGDVALFSMGRGKAFTTVEGGVILTGDEAIGQAIGKRLAAVPGYGVLGSLRLVLCSVALSVLIHPRLFWLPKSLPFLKLGETHFDPEFPVRRLSSFQAGIARWWKQSIEGLRAVRLTNAASIARSGIAPPGVHSGALPDLVRFPVLMADLDAKKKVLRESDRMGLGISDGYPDSIDGIRELGNPLDGREVPRAKEIAERLISLPLHPYVRESDIKRIVQLLARIDQSLFSEI